MSMKVAKVLGGFTPCAAILCLVISTVFMHVQKPMVAYACAIPPPIPPRRPAAAGLTPRPIDAVSISDAVKSRTPPFVDASIQACA